MTKDIYHQLAVGIVIAPGDDTPRAKISAATVMRIAKELELELKPSEEKPAIGAGKVGYGFTAENIKRADLGKFEALGRRLAAELGCPTHVTVQDKKQIIVDHAEAEPATIKLMARPRDEKAIQK